MSAPTTEAAPAEAAKAKGGGSMLPVILVVVLVPALCFATTQYLLIPKIKAAIGTAAPAEEEGEGPAAGGEKKGEAKAEGKSEGKSEAKKEGGKGEKGKGGGTGKYAFNFEFGDVIVNLAGVKGTRYLRAKFTLASSDANLEKLVRANENQLRDMAISALSTLTLDSLEAPGAKNAIRNDLIAQFNHVLHGELVEQIYFSEFVVQ